MRLVCFSLTRTDRNIEEPVSECTEKCAIFDLIESIPRVTYKIKSFFSFRYCLEVQGCWLLLTACDYYSKLVSGFDKEGEGRK